MRPAMKNEQIADMLVRFAEGKTEPWEFDDFISSRQIGKLEQARLELTSLPEQYPSESGANYCNAAGLARLKEIAEEVRSLS